MEYEIKEILDNINNKWEDYKEKTKQLEYVQDIVSGNDFKQLLDYITNLQEEKDYYFKKNNELSTLNTSLRNDRDILKTRNEKAIEYIKEKSEEVELNFYGFPDKITSFRGSVAVLLNILQGKSDE